METKILQHKMIIKLLITTPLGFGISIKLFNTNSRPAGAFKTVDVSFCNRVIFLPKKDNRNEQAD